MTKVKQDKQVIVVATSGWVFVGVRVPSPDGVLALTKAAVVRRWGTTAGLGQLCLTGPTGETQIDPVGELQVAMHAVVAIMEVADHIAIPT